MVALFHLMMNQVHGTSVPIGTQTLEPGIPFWPNYVYRDYLVWVCGVIVLSSLVLLFPAQLGPQADPFASSPAGIKPEWYFLLLYQSLRFIPGNISGLSGDLFVNLAVMVAGGLFLIVSWLDRSAAMERSNRLFTSFGLIALVYYVVTIVLAYIT